MFFIDSRLKRYNLSFNNMVKNVLSFLCIVSMIVGAYFVLSDWDDAVGNVELIKPEKHLETAIPMDLTV